MSYDTANCARVYQHDVRAKQTKVCDAEQAGFQTPTHSSNYLKTDKQLIVQGRVAFSTPSLTASLAAFPRPSMDKNGQKCTSNLQMPVFAITDDRKALRSIFRIFILYAGQHSCMYKSSCLFSLDSFGKEIKRPSASGNILALEYCGQIFCIPLGLTEKDKVEITKRFDKISFLVHGKQRRKRAIWNFLDSLYKYVNDTDMSKIVAVTTYKNMNQERRESKSGKVLKKYLGTIGPAAISWCVSENDAEALKNLLDVCEIKQETLKNAYEMCGVDTDIQVKAYLLDAIGKTKSDKETFDI